MPPCLEEPNLDPELTSPKPDLVMADHQKAFSYVGYTCRN